MKLFIIKILLFSGMIFLINLGVKLLLDNLYFKEYNEVHLNARTYLLSDSHGAAIGEFKDSTIYNFSSPSDSYFDIETKLKYLIRNSKVERVLLTVDEHTLSPYRKSLNNLDRSVYFSSKEDFLNFFSFVWHRYVKYNLVLLNPKYGPIIKNYLKSLVGITSANLNEKSWNEVPVNQRIKFSLKRYADQFVFDHSSKGLSNSLKRIIYLSKTNNIELIGIKFPITEEYRQIIGEKNYRADSFLNKNGFEIYNFNSKELSDPKYFKDQDHLNQLGANIFKEAILDSLSY
ncbi:hypothetical protein [Christiangramia sp.]|uniref:hypothetical protein n=1 Tax=Christiangramia sp. TaxID=1931228 RepID=UPI00262FB0B6|nr:hypothetical protein [Christiangramia sp.]